MLQSSSVVIIAHDVYFKNQLSIRVSFFISNIGRSFNFIPMKKKEDLSRTKIAVLSCRIDGLFKETDHET